MKLRGALEPKRLRRSQGHVTGRETVRPKPGVTAVAAMATRLRAPTRGHHQPVHAQLDDATLGEAAARVAWVFERMLNWPTKRRQR